MRVRRTVPPLKVLYEDNHCLAVDKPAGWSSTHFQGRDETMDLAVKRYLKTKYHKPGKVFLGVVQRLDRPVSGVLLFARTSKAAARLTEQFRQRTVDKIYWTVVEGDPEPAGTLEDWLLREPDEKRSAVVRQQTPGARKAVLQFRKQAQADGLSWLEIRPQTGRRHQIRVQFAQRGYPIYGDIRYGSAQELDGTIALHARSLTFLHPVRQEPITLTAEVPPIWHCRFARLLGEKAK